MPDIFTKQTIFKVNSSDLDEFIKTTYGLGEFMGTLESPNDSTHEFTVTEEPDTMWEFDEAEANEAIADGGCEYYHLGSVLQKLKFDGHIEAGDYLVVVSW